MFIEQPKQKVSRPTPERPGCWVVLRVPSQNRSFAKTYVRCTKKVRSEKLTCAHHDKWETEAQELKWQHEYNKQRVANFKQAFKEQHGREMTPEELERLGLEGQ